MNKTVFQGREYSVTFNSRDADRIACMIRDETEGKIYTMVSEAVAYRNPRDSQNSVIGRTVAFYRALEKIDSRPLRKAIDDSVKIRRQWIGA